MKKFLSVISICLVAILIFSGCSSKKATSALFEKQKKFETEFANSLNVDSSILSDEFKEEYSSFYGEVSIDQLESLIKASNTAASRLKIYLSNKTFQKKVKTSEVKKLSKLAENYYDDFSELSSLISRLEEVLKQNGKNTKSDYKLFNETARDTLLSSTKFSGRFTQNIKDAFNIKIEQDQTSVSIGSLEVIILDSLNKITESYVNIYFEVANFNSLIFETNSMSQNKIADICNLYAQLNAIPGSKFDISADEFAGVKNKFIVLNSYTNSLSSKKDQVETTIKNFHYNLLEITATAAYPNLDEEAAIVSYINSDKIDSATKNHINFIGDFVKNNLNTTIESLKQVLSNFSA